MAEQGYAVFCAVPHATPEEIARAQSINVTLVTAPPVPGAGLMSGMLRKLALPEDTYPTYIIGHARVTGQYADCQTRDFFPKAMRLHFVHMASGEIEWFKNNENPSRIAEQREKLEVSLCKSAYAVVAVGPRLRREYESLLQGAKLQGKKLICFEPGMIIAHNSAPVESIQCLVLGRSDDIVLKGLDIAALAVSKVKRSVAHQHTNLELVVRGAATGTAAELRDTLLEICGSSEIKLRVREYSSDKDDIDSDILKSSMLLMPSRSEGFGLVALEALSRGVPVLASNESGFAEFILSNAPEFSNGFVVNTLQKLDKSADIWAEAIQNILANRDAAFDQARMLRNKLSTQGGWGDAVRKLMQKM